MDIGEYQRRSAGSDVLPDDDLTLTLLGLWMQEPIDESHDSVW